MQTATPSLATLDRRSIAVQLTTPSGVQLLAGVGAYEYDPDLGAVLRVAVSDGVTSYDLMFVENRWTGSIESGEAHGCDYLLRVG